MVRLQVNSLQTNSHLGQVTPIWKPAQNNPSLFHILSVTNETIGTCIKLFFVCYYNFMRSIIKFRVNLYLKFPLFKAGRRSSLCKEGEVCCGPRKHTGAIQSLPPVHWDGHSWRFPSRENTTTGKVMESL